MKAALSLLLPILRFLTSCVPAFAIVKDINGPSVRVAAGSRRSRHLRRRDPWQDRGIVADSLTTSPSRWSLPEQIMPADKRTVDRLPHFPIVSALHVLLHIVKCSHSISSEVTSDETLCAWTAWLPIGAVPWTRNAISEPCVSSDIHKSQNSSPSPGF
jgi:hypothetical protein